MSVLFVGPLPPPVHGFSAINQAMLHQLQQRSTVLVFNRAEPEPKAAKAIAAYRIWHWLRLIWRFFWATATHKRPTLYIGLSGGKGQLLDLPFLAIARAFAINVYIHHHSFAYLNQKSRISGWAFALARNARHIVLCENMKDKLKQTYGISQDSIRVLSNAAFLTEPPVPADLPPTLSPQQLEEGQPPVTIGFLSNITEDKGIFEFFDVINTLETKDGKFRSLIAGPVSPDIEEDFQQRLSNCLFAKHLGAVYGPDKVRFFEKIDLLLFPTKYENEAEPVTILEAMIHGVPVVAATRGCIAGMIPENCGAAVSLSEFNNKALATAFLQLNSSLSFRKQQRALVQQDARNVVRDCRTQLDRLLTEISN